MPTNSAPDPDGDQGLVAQAKAAIAAGDRLRALALLDGLRHGSGADGQRLAPVVADALIATARGDGRDTGDQDVLAAYARARTALRQMLDWLWSAPFDDHDLAEIAGVIAKRRWELEDTAHRVMPEEQAPGGGMVRQTLGGGWLEWRWVSRPSGRQFGPYLYYRWRQDGRKRTRYIGKTGS